MAPKKSPNFTFTTKIIFPKKLKFTNSGSEYMAETSKMVSLRDPEHSGGTQAHALQTDASPRTSQIHCDGISRLERVLNIHLNRWFRLGARKTLCFPVGFRLMITPNQKGISLKKQTTIGDAFNFMLPLGSIKG